MNCENCGAPVVAVRGRGHFVCEHCASLHFAECSEQSPDGLTALDQDTDVGCPCCKTKLSLGSVEGVQLHYCPDCRGLLIPSEDFTFIVQQLREGGPDDSEAPTPLNPAELQRRVSCPQCGNKMEVHPYHGRGNAVIDSCHRCAVIWFDHGELGLIGRAAATG